MFKASGMDHHVVALMKAKYRRGEYKKSKWKWRWKQKKKLMLSFQRFTNYNA